MAVPYNPALNPYILNVLELPANQAAAAQVPAINVSTTQWCQSPYFLPLWGDESLGAQPPPYGPGPGAAVQGPAQALPGVATATVTRPDADINARTLAAATALNAEKARLTAASGNNTAAIAAINALNTAPVTVMSVSPSSAVHGVATPVIIQGSGFTGATAVNIGGACTSMVVVNPGEITCVTPAASVAGTSNVVVTAPGGTGTDTGAFIYT